jgi:hypothetical protein
VKVDCVNEVLFVPESSSGVFHPKSQLLVIERALETVGLMLGTDKSRGYCLEMICADFHAGANLGEAKS